MSRHRRQLLVTVFSPEQTQDTVMTRSTLLSTTTSSRGQLDAEEASFVPVQAERRSANVDLVIQSSQRQNLYIGRIKMPECNDETDLYNLYAKYSGRKVYASKRFCPNTSDQNALDALKILGDHKHIASLHGNHRGNISFMCFIAAEYTLRDCFDYIPWNETYIHKFSSSVRSFCSVKKLFANKV